MEIILSNGVIATVDKEDFRYLNQFKWHSHKGYACKTIRLLKKQRHIQMHRDLMSLKYGDGKHIDHINGNPLDNRRDNLRICTHAQNLNNRGRQKNNRSGYKGVSWHKRNRMWRARIKADGEHTFLGYFNEKEDAAMAYNEGARELHGKFAYQNEATNH